VAELAGVPRNVVDEARTYLRTLERQQRATTPPSPQQQLRFEPDSALAKLRERLTTIDVDELSPRAALDLLAELVRQARDS
jgi:DNA mismatch repair protein MutS